MKRVIVNRNGFHYMIVGPRLSIDAHSFGTPEVGLQLHFQEQPDYLRDDDPVTECCWIHGHPCWGHGVALYATHVLAPLLENAPIERFWEQLEQIYQAKLNIAFPKRSTPC